MTTLPPDGNLGLGVPPSGSGHSAEPEPPISVGVSAAPAASVPNADPFAIWCALNELVECARLRGDNELPHPADDAKLWTARMQDAWGEAEHLVDNFAEPAPND